MHHAAWVIAPLVLVGVLGFSAVAKLGKGASLQRIIGNLHLPDWVLPAPLARAVPGIELALAAGLLTPWGPVFGVAAAATLLLMLTYWALIARGLTITPRPSCGCFGQAGDHRISGRTLLRNTLLVSAAAAALALAGSGRTLWSLVADFTAEDGLWLALAGLACLVTALVLGRFEQSTPIEQAGPFEGADALTPGQSFEPSPVDEDDYVRSPTPELLLHDPASGPVTLLELSARRAQLLVFVNCYCVSTRGIITELEAWQEGLQLVDVRMVFSVPLVETLLPSTPRLTLVDHRGLTWRALGLTGSPSAVLLGVDGFLAGGPVSGFDDVRDFVAELAQTLSEAPAAGDAPGASDTGPAAVDVGQSQGQLTGDR
ncbi:MULTISPECIES: MauE/DoxX family redox-associated membrane protein [unclassified Knoellia]|uniref:MauE/DoxX family redox-associated membrane protein n=1 Tax=Knoellia altitudinis TaxID=3404795 RepID=UPI003611697B